MINKILLKLEFQIYIEKLKRNTIRKMPFLKERSKSNYSFKSEFRILNIKSSLIGQLFKHIYGVHSRGVIFDTCNGILSSAPDDIYMNNLLGNRGMYDLDKIQMLEKLVDERSTIYFLGTHIGTLLIPMSQKVKRVIGFEANPITYNFLKHNIALNKCMNASVYNLGVYDKSTYLSFYQNKANSGGSKVKPIQDNFIYNYDNPEQILIQTIRLDDFIKSQNLPFPDLIVVDIEGSEYAALKAAPECLSSCKYLYIEFVPHHLSNVAQISVETFLSVITPYFNEMMIFGRNKIYNGQNIHLVLNHYFTNGICADLLFIRNYC